MREERRWVVYLLRCAGGTFYCGATVDLGRRLAAHDAGTASRYTRARRPVRLEATSAPLPKADALGLERRVKRLPREEKAQAVNEGGRQSGPSGGPGASLDDSPGSLGTGPKAGCNNSKLCALFRSR